jgi:hypothetical protein
MNGGAKTSWRSIEAQPIDPTDAPAGVSRGRWLAALHRLQNGEALGGLRLVGRGHGHDAHTAVVTDPAEVDWTGFPILEALEAVSRDELRRLRSLLDETLHPCASPPRDDGLTPPGGLVWGIDLRRATSSEL